LTTLVKMLPHTFPVKLILWEDFI